MPRRSGESRCGGTPTGCGAFGDAAAWRNARYLFEVTVYAPTTGTVVVNRVTDPYSVALTTNSQRSVLADLNDRALKPAGWNRLRQAGAAQAGVLVDL